MLEIKDIHIQFENKVIIDKGNLCINPYEITLLVGKSGAGKTSLLNIIGLLDNQNQYQYVWNQKTLTYKEKTDFCRCHIGYVFQDYNLIEDLTISDNFKAMFNIAGRRYNKQEVIELLEEVFIDSSRLKAKAKVLSGGEKQRIAIALALVKQPQILLLDEPTANLDEKNTLQIVSILESLKEKGLMIVIATHNPEFYKANHIYRIENKTIIEDKQTENQKEVNANTEKRNRRFHYLFYALTHLSHHVLLYAFLLFALSWSLYNVSNYYMTVHMLSKMTAEYIHDISDTEILIINNQDLILEEDGWIYSAASKKIPKSIVHDISKLSHVESIYPYYSLDMTTACDINGTMVDVMNNSYLSDVQFKNNVVNIYETFDDYLFVTSCNSEYKEKECYIVDKNVTNGVFISKRLADALEIKELNHTEIKFTMPIIMGYSFSEGYAVDETGKPNTEIITTYPDEVLCKAMTYEVQGIYEPTAIGHQFYDHNGNHDIYIDYQEMERLHEQAVSDTEIMKTHKKFTDKYLLESHNTQYEMGTCMYVIKVDDTKNLAQVETKVKEMGNDIYNVKTKAFETRTMAEQDADIYTQLLLMPVIIIVVVCLLTVIIYIYTLHQRKKELSLLKANGIKSSFLLPLLNIIIILVPTVIISIILCMMEEDVISGYRTYDITNILLTLVVVFVVLLLCFIANKVYYRKTDIIQELRSK